MDVQTYMHGVGRQARVASRAIAKAGTEVRNRALAYIAQAIERDANRLLAANERDLDAARRQKLESAMIDRLTLTPKVIAAMADGLRQIAALPDPVGELVGVRTRPSGIKVGQMRVPIGVIGIIYESRPNVTADAAGLCVKSGNAVVLRGGKEAIESNALIAAVLAKALEKTGAPPEAIQFVDVTDREAVGIMLEQDTLLDLIIPRGGEEFVAWVAKHSRVPVLKHDKGLVHMFVDAAADLDMAATLVVNAKAQRPSVCNALETLLVDRAVADRFLPMVAARLSEAGVELRGCPETLARVPSARPASAADWDEEYLDLILAIRVVDGLEAAIDHIRCHGSGLAEAIVTNDLGRSRRFAREVDAAAVLVNASTRLVDGSQFGLGAEMGISTSRVHARGPVGVRELTTTKFIVQGDGQIRD
jgi:glutamate-5-semialdehyde dehydrogenase